MLILTRKKDEQIIISGNISITILEISNDKVKIGIDAPKDVKIFRSELFEDTKQTNIESSSISIEAIETLKKKLKKK